MLRNKEKLLMKKIFFIVALSIVMTMSCTCTKPQNNQDSPSKTEKEKLLEKTDDYVPWWKK